jgi:hypothetical protein
VLQRPVGLSDGQAYPPAFLRHFQVVRAFRMAFRPAVYDDEIWLDATILGTRRQGNTAGLLATVNPKSVSALSVTIPPQWH